MYARPLGKSVAGLEPWTSDMTSWCPTCWTPVSVLLSPEGFNHIKKTGSFILPHLVPPPSASITPVLVGSSFLLVNGSQSKALLCMNKRGD